MVKKLFHFMALGLLIFSVSQATAQSGPSFDKYHTNKEVQQMLAMSVLSMNYLFDRTKL